MSLPQTRLSFHVRQSTDSNVAAIHEWLQDQDEAGVRGTVNCSLGLTKKAHDEGRLLIYVGPENQAPAA